MNISQIKVRQEYRIIPYMKYILLHLQKVKNPYELYKQNMNE